MTSLPDAVSAIGIETVRSRLSGAAETALMPYYSEQTLVSYGRHRQIMISIKVFVNPPEGVAKSTQANDMDRADSSAPIMRLA